MVLMSISGSLARFVFVLLLAGSAATAVAKPQYTLKFATLAPTGSTWMNILEEWGRTVLDKSGGRLAIKFYAGGVQGDEPDVIKKIRFNQLQGGAFTGYGIGRIYSPARVMELPFLFNNYDEIDHVRAQFHEKFQQGFRQHGYELLGWMEVGFVHVFSTRETNTLEEMRHRRVWLWQGDPMGQAFFDASGISPIPLSIVDVYTSLSTGLIDTVYSTPLASIALQWFTRTPYVSSISLTNAMGALVVSRRFMDSLPADLRDILHETGFSTGEELITATRKDNETSLEELRKRGLVFIEPGDDMNPSALRRIRDTAAADLVKADYIPADVFERTRQLLEEYRGSRPEPDSTQ
jgi:TRAP-type C4-dicarboxylate transport system substrate-binding protein